MLLKDAEIGRAYLPWAVPHLKNNRYPFRSNIKKLLKCAIDKRLF